MSTKKKADTKPAKSNRAAMDANAKLIQKSRAKKLPSSPAKPAKKKNKGDTAPALNLDNLGPLEISKDPVDQIIAARVTMAADKSSLMLDVDTTAGEYLSIFDNILGLGQSVQFLIGDVINQGAQLKCFGEKYAAAMASTGRSVDSLKAYASAAKHIPPGMRNPHREVTYTHLREIVKVPKLEDKQAIVDAAVAAAEKGKPLTVKQIREKADKFKPRKTKPKATKVRPDAKPVHEMTFDEGILWDDMMEKAHALGSAIDLCGGLTNVGPAIKKPALEVLQRIGRFSAKLAE